MRISTIVALLFSAVAGASAAQAGIVSMSCQNGARYEFSQIILRGTSSTPVNHVFAGAVTLARNGAGLDASFVLPGVCSSEQPVTMQCGARTFNFSRIVLNVVGAGQGLVGTGNLAHNGAAIELRFLVADNTNCIVTRP